MSEIRVAEFHDKETIKIFINNYWKKDHVLTKSDALFDYMYRDQKNKKYNFLLSENNNQINGILGFIPTTQFDENIQNSSIIYWYSIWKVINLPGNNLQGIRLIKYLEKLFPISNFGTVGANLSTLSIYKSMKYQTGYLNNFVSFNPLIKNFKIAILKNFVIPNYQSNYSNNGSIVDISRNILDFKDQINESAKESFNYKNFNYLENRYSNYPFLNYEIWMLNFYNCKSFLIVRRINHKKSSFIKIVDYIGNRKNLSKFTMDLQIKILKESEYIEFRSFGLEQELLASGFFNITEEKNVILPYYTDPFVFKNKKIYWTLKKFKKENYIVTGDCDQDRPNTINKL